MASGFGTPSTLGWVGSLRARQPSGATRSAFLQCVTSVPQARGHTVVGDTQATGSEGHEFSTRSIDSVTLETFDPRVPFAKTVFGASARRPQSPVGGATL